MSLISRAVVPIPLRHAGDLGLNAVSGLPRPVVGIFPDPNRVFTRFSSGPATASGSNYDDRAQWLAALFELDSVAYQRIVRGWAAAHARLKNLRLAIAHEALSVRVRGRLTAGTTRFLALAVSKG